MERHSSACRKLSHVASGPRRFHGAPFDTTIVTDKRFGGPREGS